MSLKGHYSPLNLNCLGALIQSSGLTINPTVTQYAGSSTSEATYTTRGTVYTGTVLNKLADVTSLAYSLIGTNPTHNVSQTVYNNLISIGSTKIPALGNIKPSTYLGTYTNAQSKYGFLRLIALQAYNEFHINTGSYSDFLSTFSTCESFKSSSNRLIKSFSLAPTYLNGIFSNMNDLITGDIAGVSLATLFWGQDLIASGRAIDLSTIEDFGLPSNLLRTLYKNKAMTGSLNVALMSAGLTSTDINKIVIGQKPTTEQERIIYAGMCMIVNIDLNDILIPLNVQTKNLVTLADLLDPKKLFPNSYKTLTVPKYNVTAGPTNSKTYYPIYSGDTPNMLNNTGYGSRLINIIPEAIGYACDAFSASMQQIKNIRGMNIEKFAQVVTNLENVSNLTTGETNTPINTTLATAALTSIAKGSGTNGTYTSCDFFGSMSGVNYQWQQIQILILQLQNATLANIYNDMYTLLQTGGPYNTDLQTLIDSANSAITTIYNSKLATATSLNTLYNTFGTNLYKEQSARSLALPNLTDLTTTISDVYSFVDGLDQFAMQTEDNGPCQVLEAIADTTTIGGSSLIGSMRETRNAQRIALMGGVLDNDVGRDKLVLPRVTGTTAWESPVEGYTPNNTVKDISIVTGAATTPGSLAGSPETLLIPANLSIFNIPVQNSVLTPAEAILAVERCNCDCWDNL